MNGPSAEETGSLKAETEQAAQAESVRLAKAIAAGDSEAEREFVARYTRPLRHMLLARVRDADLAADLKQDILIEAICALRRGQLLDLEKLTPFVLGIARNCVNGHFRSQRRAPSVELPDDLADLSRHAEAAEDHDRENRAMRAIQTLEPTDRMILQLTLVDGLKPGVIAEKLRLNPEVVRQRKLRATRRVIEFIRTESQNRPPIHFSAGRPK